MAMNPVRSGFVGQDARPAATAAVASQMPVAKMSSCGSSAVNEMLPPASRSRIRRLVCGAAFKTVFGSQIE